MGLSRRRVVWVVVAAVVALVGIGVCTQWRLWLDLWWAIVGERDLNAAQADQVRACGDPGWEGLVKVLSQDLDTPCEDGWFGRTAAPQLNNARADWLASIANDAEETSRKRVRAASALLYAGRGPVRELAFLTAAAEMDGSRTVFVQSMASAEIESAWADPVLLDQVAVERLRQGDAGAGRSVVAWMRLVAEDPLGDPTFDRQEVVELALAFGGLTPAAVVDMAHRHAEGHAVQGVPAELAPELEERGKVCAEVRSAACMELAADLLELWVSDGEQSGMDGAQPRVEPIRTLDPLWLVVSDGDETWVEGRRAAFRSSVAWVAQAPAEERAARLLGATAGERNVFARGMAEAGFVGDPIYALRFRRATPFSSALAASSLGLAQGTAVQIEVASDFLTIRVGDLSGGVGACGTSHAPALPEEGLAAWPISAIIAQAALEELRVAVRDGERPKAARLASLAERLDAVGASGALVAIDEVLPVATENPDVLLGAAAGRALLVPHAEDEPKAELDRDRASGRFAEDMARQAADAEWNVCSAPVR